MRKLIHHTYSLYGRNTICGSYIEDSRYRAGRYQEATCRKCIAERVRKEMTSEFIRTLNSLSSDVHSIAISLTSKSLTVREKNAVKARVRRIVDQHLSGPEKGVYK